MSQFYSFKATLEALFGQPIYMELKENTDLADWKKASKKLLDAVALSAKYSVKVADDDWRTNLAGVLGDANIVLGNNSDPELLARYEHHRMTRRKD